MRARFDVTQFDSRALRQVPVGDPAHDALDAGLSRIQSENFSHVRVVDNPRGLLS
jgi:hypothetical protein